MNNSSTVFTPKVYINSQTNYYPQQHKTSQSYLTKQSHSSNVDYNTNNQLKYMPLAVEDGIYNNSNNNKSGSTSPVQGNLLVDLNLPNGPTIIRSPSPGSRQQQKRKPRLGGGGYQLSHTQHPHVVL